MLRGPRLMVEPKGILSGLYWTTPIYQGKPRDVELAIRQTGCERVKYVNT
jgi:hypothetical protein